MEFGVKPLFADASFVVNDRDRIALVGKNGAGKSTLLKILCGMQHPTAGTVSVPQETTIGYLPQVMKLTDSTTVREEAQKAFADVARLKERVDRLERQLGNRIDLLGNINDAHFIGERAMKVAAIINQRRGWKDPMAIRVEHIRQIVGDCMDILRGMPEFRWWTYEAELRKRGYEVRLNRDIMNEVRGYTIKMGNSSKISISKT